MATPGTVVGRYRLVEELGRGGMAVVYRAERLDGDFEHQVALKQILGPASESLVRRLEQERQILARATHPDIARLLDGGVDRNGRPYLVMELIDGLPVDEYCDRERLSVRRRLGLFLRIARAVQYAHRNLVVHRDIKPSNILVTGDGDPKLLDFGIARLLDASESPIDRTLTSLGPRPMTPAYASPEQIRSEGVTTLSDVYQLGLLLYLLLTGRTPYRRHGSSSPLDLARVIDEEPPTHPSKVLIDADGSDPEADGTISSRQIAQQRGTTPAHLVRTLRGDLGSIVLMALRKEPERRYASAEKMVEDIERHLAGRTVAARPDSLGYRLRTFCRRHRVAVVFAGLFTAALVSFTASSVLQSRRLAAERDRANRESETSAAVAGFLTDLFRLSDPGEARGNTVTAREILDRGRAEIDQRMAEPTLVRSRLKRTMGEVYENLGLYDDALPLYERSLATAVELSSEESPEAVSARAALARLFQRQGRYAESERLTRTALDVRRPRLGEEHPETLDLESQLAGLAFLQGRRSEAETRYRRVLEVRRRILGADHPDTLGVVTSLGSVLFNGGRLNEAEELYQMAFEGLGRRLGPDHPLTLKVASNLGSVQIQRGRFDEAEPLLRSTLEQRRKVLGEDHPATLTTESNLAGLLSDRGDHDEGERHYRHVYERRLATLGTEHPKAFDALYDLAWAVSLDPARWQEAVGLYEQALAGTEATRGPEHRYAIDALYEIAVLEARGGRWESGLARFRQAVERGYARSAVFDESAFEPLAEHPEMQALLEVVRKRLDSGGL